MMGLPSLNLGSFVIVSHGWLNYLLSVGVEVDVYFEFVFDADSIVGVNEVCWVFFLAISAGF